MSAEPEDAMYIDLIKKIQSYHPSKDFSLVLKAYHVAEEAHKNQARKSGEPYIIHPLQVAQILAELELDLESIVAGILHDLIEDTDYSFEDVVRDFSTEIAQLVDGVTKLGKINYSTKEELQAENYRKMFLAMAKDIRVILVKLADRLHNMRTLNYMAEHKQIEKAQETLDIYAPLADRLGISKIKTELEDLCLKYLEPEEYHILKEKINKKLSDRQDYVDKITQSIRDEMKTVGIEGIVEGRPKHFFSIYKKMQTQHRTFDQIYDLFAVRVIVNTERDCYAVLGVVHDMYKPMPERFKDYIAMPKKNMYQSLHNTLIGPEGIPFEVQIRTKEMHRTAEYGIAAHWKYKVGKAGEETTANEERKLSWLRQILEWQTDMSDNIEFMEALKRDLNIYTGEVYVFTPRGDVKILPKGSTPIDLAYSIHTAIGNKMIGARANEKIVAFEYEIKNGDRIEIITSHNSKGPSLDWLKIVKSAQARNKINQWFRKEYKEENISKGKDLLEKEAKKRGFALSDLTKSEWIKFVLNKYGFNNWEALCAAIGYGGVKEGQIINRLREEQLAAQKKAATHENIAESGGDLLKHLKTKGHDEKHKSGVIIKGFSDLSIRYARCCNPVPGDEIVGFITRGRGVSIHRTDCTNIINLEEANRKRLVDSEWDMKTTQNVFDTEIRIIGTDQKGILVHISTVFNDENIPVKLLNAKTTDNRVTFNVVISITDKRQLEKIYKKLKRLKGVEDVERVIG